MKCDIKLSALVLKFFRIPERKAIIERYQEAKTKATK